jgi:hypothetical protein
MNEIWKWERLEAHDKSNYNYDPRTRLNKLVFQGTNKKLDKASIDNK